MCYTAGMWRGSLALLLTVAGCAGGVASSADAGRHDVAVQSGPLPACSWPSSLDRPDSDTAGWWVSRTLVVCGEPMGASAVCASDGGTGDCDTNLRPCVMACGEHQYLVTLETQMPVFGTPDSAQPYSPTLVYPTLPDGCTSPSPLVPNSELSYQCCPCEAETGTAPDASDSGACVAVTIAPSDLACSTDADCTTVVTGELCTAPCCPEEAVNTSAAARFATLTAGLPPPVGGCGPCGMAPVACIAGACVDR